MTTQVPWIWTPNARGRLVKWVAVLGSALSAAAFVRMVLGNDALLNHEWSTPSVVLSTGVWTWLFLRILRKFKSGLHAVWLGPCLGALNAGTSLALVYLTNGEGVGAAAGGLMTGTVFGTWMGGGPLGLLYGVALGLFLGFSRDKVTPASKGPPLRLLAGSAAWLANVAMLTLIVDAQHVSAAHWPALALGVVASALGVYTLAAHGRATRWIWRARRGRHGHHVIAQAIDGTAKVYWREKTQEGPFRTGEQQRALGEIPANALATLSAQTIVVLGACVVQWTTWALVGVSLWP